MSDAILLEKLLSRARPQALFRLLAKLLVHAGDGSLIANLNAVAVQHRCGAVIRNIPHNNRAPRRTKAVRRFARSSVAKTERGYAVDTEITALERLEATSVAIRLVFLLRAKIWQGNRTVFAARTPISNLYVRKVVHQVIEHVHRFVHQSPNLAGNVLRKPFPSYNLAHRSAGHTGKILHRQPHVLAQSAKLGPATNLRIPAKTHSAPPFD